jgi:hypothetical protein
MQMNRMQQMSRTDAAQGTGMFAAENQVEESQVQLTRRTQNPQEKLHQQEQRMQHEL